MVFGLFDTSMALLKAEGIFQAYTPAWADGLPTAILVAGMTFNDLMTEYPLSAFLYNVNNRPLPIAIVDGAMSPDPEEKAVNLVYSVLIMGFPLAVILFAERIGLGKGPKTGAQ